VSRAPLPTKPCAVCGRTITWRRKWADDWPSVRYCSQRCRRARRDPTADALETAIRDLLARRGAGKTICPSEAARRVAEQRGEEDWRVLMEPARQAARRLVAAGEVELTQRGQVVDPDRARGPIRIRAVR